MNPRKLGLVVAVLVGCELVGGHAAASEARPAAGDGVATPIVSEVLGAPEEYAGRRAKIHGMVAGLEETGFWLQDVSQQLIQVHNDTDWKPELYGAVTVSGIIRREKGEMRLTAERIDRVDEKVLGGPCGCSSSDVRADARGE